jgi:hypothetical protein
MPTQARSTLPCVALVAILLSSSGAYADGRLDPVPMDRQVPVSVSSAEPWSWAGVPMGEATTLGVPFRLPMTEPDGGTVLASVGPCALPGGSAVAWVVLSPVAGPHLASVRLETPEATVTVPATEAALGWLGPEPANRRLLVVRYAAPEGQALVRVSVSGAYLWAVTVGDADAARDGSLLAAYEAARATWTERLASEVPPARQLRDAAAKLPAGRIAFLPPVAAIPPAVSLALGEAGLTSKLARLQPTDLIDPERFSAATIPVLLYAGGEQYLRSVYKQGDAAEAVRAYLAGGGALVLVSTGPYPLYYAVDAWNSVAQPDVGLLSQLGIRLSGGFEEPPDDSPPVIHPAEGQTLLTSMAGDHPFPRTGDTRLRTFAPVEGSGVSVTPLLEVRDPSGRSLGLCAALFTLPGNGQVLYIWEGLSGDLDLANGLMADVVRWVLARAGAEVPSAP